MSGGYYIALSGMRARLDQLDRLSEDLANTGTAGFKGERVSNANAPRPAFGDALETAIDVSVGRRRLDMRQGTVTPTGRQLDIAIQGDGFLLVQTPNGPRYTRNGNLLQAADGSLKTSDGSVVLGEDGPIKLGTGVATIADDGTVMSGNKAAGKLQVVRFNEPRELVREGGAILRAGPSQVPQPVDGAVVKSGVFEESNVSVSERIGELTGVSRSFQALQKAVSVLMNDVDGRAIDSLGRR
ncbi:MAG: flagellar hook basal-body protein [Vicinamibacterales bacterium]|jgi:flagellar basal body rod protein FlgG